MWNHPTNLIKTKHFNLQKTLERESVARLRSRRCTASRNFNPCEVQVTTEINRELSLQVQGIETRTEN
jgi:hypothetical protein